MCPKVGHLLLKRVWGTFYVSWLLGVLATPLEIKSLFFGYQGILGCRFWICKKFWNSSPPPGGCMAGGEVGFILYLCVRCPKLGYLIGWFRIWKNFFDPTPLGADSGGGRGAKLWFSSVISSTMCMVSIPILFDRLIQNLKEFSWSCPPWGGFRGDGKKRMNMIFFVKSQYDLQETLVIWLLYIVDFYIIA